GLADPQAMVVVEACAAAFERVGLPEGLYPLAQAALYLAGAEKSNSLLGFFDALKTVRAANKQDVPSHLRDANRDGAAFGDGVGYRYPHAYAEHWVEQQYLPTALQGEVFWQPGALGWEGERRERMAERRAAQLAAAVELAADQPLLLSSGPDDPGLDRWIQRQIGQGENRLDHLRQRLWDGARWQRNDRVLLIGVRSLLWAIDPLKATPEGGVTLLVSDQDAVERLRAQLELLDPSQQPQLLQGDLEQLQNLPVHQRFEWIGGRLTSRDFPGLSGNSLLQRLSAVSQPGTQLRLMISHADAGPATTLLSEAKAVTDDEREQLTAVLQQEESLLGRQWQRLMPPANSGWRMETSQWQEPLLLPGGQALAQRWLEEGSPYRSQLDALDADALALLRALLKRRGDQPLRLPMQHRLFSGVMDSGVMDSDGPTHH
ncbi:MAG: recombination protein RarA, partial [Synechococcus sp.]